MCAVPVMAQEVTDPKTILTQAVFEQAISSHQDTVMNQVNAVAATMADKDAAAKQIATVKAQVAKYNKAEAENYVNYLKKAVVNLKETERIKKEVVDNYTTLAQNDPQFAALLPAATLDYNNAVAARAKVEADIQKALADFAVKYQ